MRIEYLIFSICIMLAQGCGFNNDDGPPPVVCDPVPAGEQSTIIDDYITQNNLTVQTTASGLRYSIETPGTGDNIVLGDLIEIDFQGRFLDGTVFDEGTIGPTRITDGSFIPGFQEGLLLLNEGAQAILILPGAVAYGCFPPPGSGIGDNQILVFEVTVLSVNP